MKHLLERGGLSGREFYSAKWRPQMGAHLLQGFHGLGFQVKNGECNLRDLRWLRLTFGSCGVKVSGLRGLLGVHTLG